ncbi:hypothetical protein E3V39_01765 [Gammaproteobacteria bacterium LSUCC0112]|nr:hypothetical protein E3V39_01765 [Gammaproteobacteria bacterium LSUCC0112]
MSSHNTRTFSLGGRLTIMMTGLVLISVVSIASIMYMSYKQSFERVTLTKLEVAGDLSVKSFLQWAQARQDEMAYLASLDTARFGDLAQLEHLMQRIAESQGFYDTIFLVDTTGFGVIGVAYDGQARIMPSEEAQAFAVADREWFRQAMRGEDAFSQPVVSRATGNVVSTVAIPVRVGQEIVAVVRGAVRVDTILTQVSELSLGEGSKAYLLDSNALPVTPARAGESGRGFAVVADEVRSLAGRTKQSTTEIQATIEKLQSGALRAEKVMLGSREVATQMVDRVAETDHALERISQGVLLIEEMTQQIASAADQQTAAVREININIHGISDVAESTGRSVEQSGEASESLANLAERLRGLVLQFRV